MKVQPGFTLKQVADSYVIVATGDNIVDFSQMISINETGAFLWEILMNNDVDEKFLAERICSEYEGVSYDDALADAKEFISVLLEKKVLK